MSEQTRVRLVSALIFMMDGGSAVQAVELIQQLIREEIEAALELERAHVK
jgi:hypothetical protein